MRPDCGFAGEAELKYILLSDLKNAEDFDDGLYVIKARVTEDDESEPTMEPFSEGDLYKIRKLAPGEADCIAFTDDWMFCNLKEMLFFDYVFSD
jgi:hypothetical protein